MDFKLSNISPCSEDKKTNFVRVVHRIATAHKFAHRAFHKEPLKRDCFPEHEAVVAWNSITCSYSGIEQAMKCLMKIQDSFIDKPLRCGGHRHHDIGKLFLSLTFEEQEALRLSFQVYRSLHNYIPFETVDGFLNSIDEGYQSWRYLLLDGQKSKHWPKTHPGAMLEIWFALSDILCARVFTNHGLHTIKDRIDFYFRKMHWKAGLPSSDSVDIGTINNVMKWLQKEQFEGINTYCRLLYCHKNKLPFRIGENDSTLPAELKETSVLDRFIQTIKQQKRDNDFAYFFKRAENENITWDFERFLFR